VAVPVVIGGLFLLMTNGFLTLAVVLLVLAVLGLLGTAGWQLRRGHRKGPAILTAGALVVVAAVGWYGWTLNKTLDDITQVPDGSLDVGERPAAPEEPTEALNILLMGADNPEQLVDKPTIAELLAEDEWDPGAYRSDTVMVMHIPADREAAYIVSVPRDSYVEIYDDEGQAQGKNKVNEAFAAYGPFGTWRTVENLSGIRLDHMAIIDYGGFKDLTTAIGGVDVYIPEAVYDSKLDQQWDEGWVHLEDQLALNYVRMRYGLLNGDFDRVARQQNFLRALLRKTLSDEVVGDPTKFPDTLRAVVSHLTVDQGWSKGDLRSLALQMRGLETRNVEFLTLPFDRYGEVDGMSVNFIDEQRSKELWKAFADDRIDAYLQKSPDDELADPRQVS